MLQKRKLILNQQQILATPGSEDFARFNLYAPYIKSLNVYGTKLHYYTLIGWRPLLIQRQTGALLPNLLSLIIHTSCDSHGLDQLMWISVFKSSSLVEYQVIPGDLLGQPPVVSHIAASVILQTILGEHPRLRKLAIFPSAERGTDADDGENNLLTFLWRRPFEQWLKDTEELEEITSTLALVRSAPIKVISTLPCLKSLTLYSGTESVASDAHDLSPSSFPSLRRLAIWMVSPWDVSNILRVQPMVKSLTHLELKLNLSLEHESPPEWIISELFPLFNSTPHLTSLDLVVDPYIWDDPYDCGRQSLLDIMSRLPLTFVSLFGLHLGDLTANGALLRATWPHVTELRLPHELASFPALVQFAALPNLQKLVLDFDWDIATLPGVIHLEFPTCPLHTLMGGAKSVLQSEPDHIQAVARYVNLDPVLSVT
jgi:hypothetical protein